MSIYRQLLEEAGAFDELFAQFEARLEEKGFAVKTGKFAPMTLAKVSDPQNPQRIESAN